MAVGHEDVAVRRDGNIARPAERVGAFAAHAFRAERHQQFSVGAVLEHLLADAVARLAVGDPEVAEAIDAEAVRPREQLLAPHLQDLAGTIELDDRHIGAVKRVDLPAGVDRHAGHLAPCRAVRQRSPARNQAIWCGLSERGDYRANQQD